MKLVFGIFLLVALTFCEDSDEGERRKTNSYVEFEKQFNKRLNQIIQSEIQKHSKGKDLMARVEALESGIIKPLKKLPVKPEKQWFTGASSNRCGYVNIYEVNCKWSHDRAFTDSEDDYWCSGRGTYAWSTGSSGHSYDGIEIWRRFTEPHNLAKISFKSLYKIDKNVSVEVIAAHVVPGKWHTLLHVDYPGLVAKQSKTWYIPTTYIDQPFSYFGLRFHKDVEDIDKDDRVCIGKIGMWEFP